MYRNLGGASMPRAARIKAPTAIYHIMSRSITEFDLFPENSDKEYFLDLLKKYSEKFNCKVYCYCLMTNHYHLILDTCGYDISKFMKRLNQTYVKFINKVYSRRGHLLAERFNSKIIDTTEYLLTVSAYLHNNAKDLPDYCGKEFEYTYSSMGFYLGKVKDKKELVDTDFILGCVNESDKTKARKVYEEMVIERRDAGINRKLKQYLEEFMKEQFVYKSYREVVLRDKNPEEIIKKVAELYGIKDILELSHRWKRSSMQFRQVVVYSLNVFCGMNISEVCKKMNNITASCCARLGEKGYELVCVNAKIKSILFEM
jgi:putative transposase